MATTDRFSGIVGGEAFKTPVVCATTANITLSGTQTIDDIAVVADDRVLVKDQSDGTENGIYVVAATAWTRADDWDGSRDIVQGTLVFVAQGTTNAGLVYYVSTANDITIGTTSVAFTATPTLSTSAFIDTLLDDTTAAAARTTLGLGDLATQNDSDDLALSGDNTISGDNAFSGINTFSVAPILSGVAIEHATHTEAANATTSDIWSGGNICLLSGGAVTFTDIADAPQAGAMRVVIMNAAHTITDNAALEVDGNRDYLCKAGDVFLVTAKTTSTFRWNLISYGERHDVGAPVQSVFVQDSTSDSNIPGTVVPFDDTIPQNTEGDEYMSLAITPTNASNILEIEVIGVFTPASATNMTMALFQDSTAGALSAVTTYQGTANGPQTMALRHRMVAGTASATTFKIRSGPASSINYRFNSVSAGQLFGGVCGSSIHITEIKV